MKLRLGDTVIELANIAYANKVLDDLVVIYFVGIQEPLEVDCGEDQRSGVRYEGSADELITKIEKSKAPDNITFASRIG